MQDKIDAAVTAYRKYFDEFKDVKKVIAFTGGKDSTVLLELAKMAFGSVPCDVFYIDSGLDHKETVDFIEEARQHWGFNLVKEVHKETLDHYHTLESQVVKRMVSRMLKIETIKQTIKKHDYGLMVVGIRHDEHEARSHETVLSKREDHVRLHPILDFTEKDIWNFIHKYNVPHNPLYKQGYRSLGEEEFTEKVADPNAPERAGREPDKEKLMKRLRELGYF